MSPNHKNTAVAASAARTGPFSFPANPGLWACRRPARRRPRSGAIAIIAVLLFVTLSTPFADAGTPAVSAPDAVRPVASIATSIAEASLRFGIPASWLRAVIRAESAGDPFAVSPKGAMGLMQIMPETWASLWRRYGLGADPFDAHDNILAGAAYLRELHHRFGAPGFLAAYDAGPARYDEYLAAGRPLPSETLAYVDRLAPLSENDAADQGVVPAAATRSWLEAPLFVAHPDSSLTPSLSTLELHGRHSPVVVRLADLTGLVAQSSGLFAATAQQSGTQ